MSATGRTLLTADWVVGHADRHHVLFRHGEVVFEKGEIIFVGHGFSGEVAQRRDYGRALIAPGFVDLDALSDLDTTILSFDNHPSWRKGRTWPKTYMDAGPYEMYSPEELVFQKRHAFARLIRNGITTALPIASLYYRAWGETYDEFAGAAQAAEDLGLRVYLGPAYRTGNPYVVAPDRFELHFDEERGLNGLSDAIAFCKAFEGKAGGLIRTMLAPDRIETCTPRLLERTAAAGTDLDVPVRLHCCQGAFERDTVRRLHGMTSIEWLASLRFMSERTLLPHGIFVSPSHHVPGPGRDLDIVREAGAVLVHCPLVSARFGEGLESFKTYRARGLRMGLGTDTSPPDMLLNMQIGLILCRLAEHSATACRSEDYFDAATLGGADALGRRDLGRLAAGCRADIVVWNLAGPDIGQVVDPIQTLMIGGTGRDVHSVIIDGRFVMEDRTIPGMDYEADVLHAQRQFEGLVARYPDRTFGHPGVSEIFSTAYPVIARPE